MGALVRVEVDEIENIQKEVENNAIDLESVSERWVMKCHNAHDDYEEADEEGWKQSIQPWKFFRI